jgi:hypothetical protein
MEKPLTEAILSFLSGVFFHDRDIPVGLICDHLPATPEARQNRGFRSALSQEHQAMTFLSLRPATACFACFPPRIKIGQLPDWLGSLC